MRENRLRWFGRVVRRKDWEAVRMVMELSAEEEGKDQRRSGWTRDWVWYENCWCGRSSQVEVEDQGGRAQIAGRIRRRRRTINVAPKIIRDVLPAEFVTVNEIITFDFIRNHGRNCSFSPSAEFKFTLNVTVSFGVKHAVIYVRLRSTRRESFELYSSSVADRKTTFALRLSNSIITI